MANERLRAAIFSSHLSIDDIAHELGVDRKTIERWIAGRLPYKRHRYALAHLLGADPAYLWPTQAAEQANELALAEVVAIYPVRSNVPNDAWLRLFEQAHEQIEVLVYAGFWLSEDPAVRRLLVRKAKANVRVRVLLGDPDSAEVHQRGLDEGIDTAISAKIANTIHNYRDVIATPNTQFRLHDTVLYNSIYRADEEMLVNTHLYGLPAHMNPLMHLRKVPGAELFSSYADSLERVWAGAQPLDRSERVVA